MKLVLRTIQFNNKRVTLRGADVLSKINKSTYFTFPQSLIMKSLKYSFSTSK